MADGGIRDRMVCGDPEIWFLMRVTCGVEVKMNKEGNGIVFCGL